MACGCDKPGEWNKEDDFKETIDLNCPVCFEIFKTPRSLTCLHTFCEGCITSLLLEAAGKGSLTSVIQCPLCRQETETPVPSKPPAEWARELPLNLAIVPMLKATESESRQCNNCAKKKKVQRPAESFCVDCNEFQCSSCVENHKDFTFMENHRVVAIDDGSAPRQLYLGRGENCVDHIEKKLEFFCEDHDFCCCSTCAIVKHRGCRWVTEIRELGRALKQGDKPIEVKANMEQIQKQLADLIKILETNLSDLVQQAVDIPQQIKEIRSQIIETLDQLVDAVTSECGQLKKQQTTEIEDKITGIRSQEAALNASRQFFEVLTKHGTETQLFVAFSRIENQVKQYQQEMENMQRSLASTKLQLSLNEVLNGLMKSTVPLAKVTVNQERRYVPIAEQDVSLSPIFSIGIHRQMEHPGYGGAELLSDGRLIATDYNNKICCFLDGDYNVIAEVKLSSYPKDMTVMNQSEAVVVLPLSNQLQRISVGTNLTKNSTIPCTRKPRCVSRVSDTELVVGWDQGLSIIDMHGTEKTYMDKDSTGREIKFCEDSRILADTVTSRLYQSSGGNQAVYGMGMTGTALFTYTNNLNNPAGLALDWDRNLYVCSWGTKSVHQISPDGQAIRIIDVGFEKPGVIFFDRSGAQLTVIQSYPTQNIRRVSFESTNV